MRNRVGKAHKLMIIIVAKKNPQLPGELVILATNKGFVLLWEKPACIKPSLERLHQTTRLLA